MSTRSARCGASLCSADVMRSQPFSDASTVSDASARNRRRRRDSPRRSSPACRVGQTRKTYAAKIASNPSSPSARSGGSQGSNEWAIAGRNTMDGLPLVANDPHLSLGAPSTFLPIGLRTCMDVEGEGFAGTRASSSHNRFIRWAPHEPDGRHRHVQRAVVPRTHHGLFHCVQGGPRACAADPETFRYNSGGSLTTADGADGVRGHADRAAPATRTHRAAGSGQKRRR